MSHTKAPETLQSLTVYRSDDICVTNGVAEGDGISFADELMMDDIYQVEADAALRNLVIEMNNDGLDLCIAKGSSLGRVGNPVYLDCCVTFMALDGSTREAIVIVEVEDGGVEDVYLLPMAPLQPLIDYRLVGVDRDTAIGRFAELGCVSFARGTRITLASGEQRPIELLKVGDKVLTRDDGAQEIRWVGQTTLRATGEFAPVVIRKGTLNNSDDLMLSPDHRIFIYQREDRLGAGRSEVLVRARHLINNDTVFQQGGGYVDYFQLLFDHHQIIYAEGIATESLLIDQRTRQALPDGVHAQRHEWRHHLDYEVNEKLVAKPDAAELLRKASSS